MRVPVPVTLADVGRRPDPVHDVGIGEEMLAQALARRQPVPVEQTKHLGASLAAHRRNTAAARVDVASATSSSAIPHTSARACPLKDTQAGSLGSPRCGGGAR